MRKCPASGGLAVLLIGGEEGPRLWYGLAFEVGGVRGEIHRQRALSGAALGALVR